MKLLYIHILLNVRTFIFAVEEIQCLAVWKEGSYRYLVGKVSNYHIASGEDHYRCFVFEKSTSGSIALDSDSTPDPDVEYRIAQSGDATCTGLFSPIEGSRTMILKRSKSPLISIIVILVLPCWDLRERKICLQICAGFERKFFSIQSTVHFFFLSLFYWFFLFFCPAQY